MKLVSAVTPCYNEEASVDEVSARMRGAMQAFSQDCGSRPQTAGCQCSRCVQNALKIQIEVDVPLLPWEQSNVQWKPHRALNDCLPCHTIWANPINRQTSTRPPANEGTRWMTRQQS